MKNNNLEVALTKEVCIICGKEMNGAIVMNTILTKHKADKVKELHNKVVGFAKEPCDSCKADMEKAFMLIGFNKEKSDLSNLPEGFYRTGHVIGVKKTSDLVQHFIKPDYPEAIDSGYIFMPDTALKKLGLIE